MANKPSQFDISTRSLAGIEILVDVPNETVEAITANCEWLEFRVGDVVIDQSDKSSCVYFVIRGRLEVMNFVGADQQVVIAGVDAGETFGELSAIDLKVRSARVTTVEPTLLASYPSGDFRTLIETCPTFAMAMLKRFTGLIRTLTARVSTLTTLSPHQRVYYELLRISEPHATGDGSWMIENAPNHSAIADAVGIDRQVVADAIGSLAREGVLERKHKNFIIKDHARLQKLVGQ